MEKDKIDPLAPNQIKKYEFYKKTTKVRDNIIRNFVHLPKSTRYVYAVQIMRELEKVIKHLLLLDRLNIYNKEEAEERMRHHRKTLVYYELVFMDMTNAKVTNMFDSKCWDEQFNNIESAIKMYEGMYKRDYAKYKELFGGKQI